MALSVNINSGTINTVQEITKISEVSEIKKVDNVSIKAFPCPKVNDKGLTGAWWWADKIAIAVQLWATYESWKAAKEEYKIGKRYYDLAKQQWDHFYTYYRPLEEQELSEIWAEKPYTPDYSAAVKGHTHLIDRVTHNADRQRQALSAKYCICSDVGQFTKTDITKSTIFGDSDNFARRYAEKLAQERNDIRWARRVAAASRGRGLLSTSASFASKAVGFFSAYSQAMSGLAGNASNFRGYISARNETEYNPVRQRIDSRAAIPQVTSGMNPIESYGRINFYESNVGRSGLSFGADMAGSALRSGFDPTGYVTSSDTL